jgi:5'-nucleotidase
MVAPATQQSGKGGTIVLPSSNLTGPAAFNTAPAGAPYFGRNSSDSGLAYFNSTPAATSFWAIDQVKPFGGKIDLFVSGPNEGTNLGPLLYTLSGTIGAAYAAVGRGYPAMAFSSSSSMRDYHTLDLDSTKDESGEYCSDCREGEKSWVARCMQKRRSLFCPLGPLTVIIGTATANFVSTYADALGSTPLLPNGIGLNINYASLNSTACPSLKPDFKRTRLTGGAESDKLVLNSAGLPTYASIVPKGGLNTCNVGDCSLEGETDWVASGACKASVSVFAVDYDAPSAKVKAPAKAIDAVAKKLNKN